MKKVYRGKRLAMRNLVEVNNRELKSPDGVEFDWGKMNGGSFQLAYAILLEYFGDELKALRYRQLFQERLIAIIPVDKWVINESAIKHEIEIIERMMKDKTVDGILAAVSNRG